jgi:membrane associated rhomboid family serine protease
MQFNITVVIIIVTVLVSLAGFNNKRTIDSLIFYPPAINRGQWYRFFTSGAIHADIPHLAFNMLSLYFFGPAVEHQMQKHFGDAGIWLYVLLYVSALFFSILPTYLKHRDSSYYRSLGASGAVSAILFAGFLVAPTIEVTLIFLPFFDIPGFVFGPLYLLFSAYLDRKGGDNINHSAHIWGALYGVAFLLIVSAVYQYPVLQEGLAEIRNYISEEGWKK